jgi:hypothetical protein
LNFKYLEQTDKVIQKESVTEERHARLRRRVSFDEQNIETIQLTLAG